MASWSSTQDSARHVAATPAFSFSLSYSNNNYSARPSKQRLSSNISRLRLSSPQARPLEETASTAHRRRQGQRRGDGTPSQLHSCSCTTTGRSALSGPSAASRRPTQRWAQQPRQQQAAAPSTRAPAPPQLNFLSAAGALGAAVPNQPGPERLSQQQPPSGDQQGAHCWPCEQQLARDDSRTATSFPSTFYASDSYQETTRGGRTLHNKPIHTPTAVPITPAGPGFTACNCLLACARRGRSID